ncbi:MAG TPA: hypothetical protein VKW70_00660 [Terriglobia bacterium]|nr:hypothetical protein [Terriglobia bacterium]
MTRNPVRFFVGSLIAAALLVPLVGPRTAQAQDRTPVLNQRQRNQQRRIRQGIKSGELTRGEARRLEAREGRLEANKLEDKAKGPLTPKERAQLQRQANRDSRAIYRLKHNNKVR